MDPRADAPFRQLAQVERILWLSFSFVAPVVIVAMAHMVVGGMSRVALGAEEATMIAAVLVAVVLVAANLLGRTQISDDRMEAVAAQSLTPMAGTPGDPVVPPPMRPAYRQAAHLNRVAMLQLALVDAGLMAGLVLALLGADVTPAYAGAAGAVTHGVLNPPKVRDFLRAVGKDTL